MYIDLLVYPLLFLGKRIYAKDDSDKSRLHLIIYCSFILLLKATLRSVSVGTDTSHYFIYYYEHMEKSWSQVFSAFLYRYQHLSGEFDHGYNILQKAFGMILPDFHLFTFAVQAIFIYWPIGTLVYRNLKKSKHVLFAYILFCAMFMGLPMSNARQMYAVGLCIWAFMFLTKKRYLYASVMVFISYFIHQSSLIFIFVFFIAFINMKWIKKINAICVVLFFFVFGFVNQIIQFMGESMDNAQYAGYGGHGTQAGTYNYIIFTFIITLFSLIMLWDQVGKDQKQKMLFGMLAPTFFFCPLITADPSMIRLTLYFQIYSIIQIPQAVENSKLMDKNQMLNIMIAALIFLSISSAAPYYFFWQEDQNPYLYYHANW